MPNARIVALSAACLLLAPLAFPAGAGDPKPFTAKELNRFIADYPAFAAHMRDEGETLRNVREPETWETMQVTSRMTDHLKKQGWEPERFLYVISHVAAGLAAVTLEEQAPALEEHLAEAHAEIMDNPYLSQEMKQQLLDQMRQGLADMRKLDQAGRDVPEEELQLIRKNKKRILKAFEGP